MSVMVRGGATNPAGRALPTEYLRRGLGGNCDSDIGAAVGGVQRGHHAGVDLRRGLGAAGFAICIRPGGLAPPIDFMQL